MSHNTLPTVAELSGEMRERLAKVKYVFTDLDATMLAPGSCVLRDNDGNPSTKLVEAVVALARAGIQVVPTSGRNRTMIHEDARVLVSTPTSARWVAWSCTISRPTTGSI